MGASNDFVSPWKSEPLATCWPSMTISIKEFPRAAVTVKVTPVPTGDAAGDAESTAVAVGEGTGDAEDSTAGLVGLSLLTLEITTKDILL